MVGEVLLHYRIDQRLGAGGMGVVWKATDTHLGREVALKLLPPEATADPVQVKRFLREARSASVLNHPNIVTIYEANSAGDTPFIAMEYVRGVTLQQKLKDGPLGVARSIEIALEVCAALEHSHEAGIIHRDLKPGNIMLTPSGGIKVLDFGLAKQASTEEAAAADAETASTLLTGVGVTIGTAAYMSPEQALGDTVDCRTDVFSLGLVLYEMLSNRRPFDGQPLVGVLRRVVHSDAPPLRDFVPDVPESLEQVLGQCLEKERERRYRSAADVASALRAVRSEVARGASGVAAVKAAEARGQNTTLLESARSLWGDLRERRVARVGIGYAAASWLLLQVARLLIDASAIPDWILPPLFFVLGAGFLIAVVVARQPQLIPERDAHGVARFRTAGDVIIFAIIALAISLSAFRQFGHRFPFPTVASLPTAMTAPRPSDKSIAVLRFATFGADTAFSDGLGEHLLNLLARVRELQVPSREVTWLLSDQQLDPRRIAEELRVRYLLEGSVQQSDKQVRVTAQLIDASSGNHVWSDTYDGILSADTFFSVQEAIAQQVFARLETTLSAGTVDGLRERGTHNDEALRQYVEGRRLLNEPRTEEVMTAAVAAFEAATRADARFAEAYAGLCDAQLAWYVTDQDTSYFDAAEAACIRALRIDATLGEVYAALGRLHRYSGQLEDAESELLTASRLLNRPASVLDQLGRTYQAQQKLMLAEQTFNEAIVKEPANSSGYTSMGNFFFRTGRYAEALPYYKQVVVMQRDSAAAYTNIGAAFFMLGDFPNASVAWRQSLELEPSQIAYMNYANSFYYQGRYAASIDMYRKAIELGANNARVWGGLAASCGQVAGEQACRSEALSRAIELINQSLAINPRDADALSQLASYYARMGRRDEAIDLLNELSGLDWEEPNVSYFIAVAHLALGDSAKAVNSINQAIIRGYPRVLADADPEFSSLRGQGEFDGIGTRRPN